MTGSTPEIPKFLPVYFRQGGSVKTVLAILAIWLIYKHAERNK